MIQKLTTEELIEEIQSCYNDLDAIVEEMKWNNDEALEREHKNLQLYVMRLQRELKERV